MKMTKQITLQMSETDAVDTFTVSEQYVKQWCDSIDNINKHVVTEQEIAEFQQVVDSVYATLTHKQKSQLLAEALETFNSVQDYMNSVEDFCKNTDYVYEVSARRQLATCITCSLTDYYDAVPA